MLDTELSTLSPFWLRDNCPCGQCRDPRTGQKLIQITDLPDVPTRDGQVREIARTFGFVRETNYGTQFEVRVEEKPNNLAFTNVAITPHTDNPYGLLSTLAVLRWKQDAR